MDVTTAMPEINENGKFASAVTVTQLNEYIKGIIDRNKPLTDVYLKGEISNFKNHHSTGHMYFSLKDEGGVISAVMFRSAAVKLMFVPEDGMKVIVHGRVSAFVRTGQYQIYADSMEPDGIGALYIAYEQTKKRLEREGLFDPARKKPLPKIPTRVGIITSATGAAVRDMINISARRFPYAKLIIYPSLVQGPDAAPQLRGGIEYFNKTNSVDVIIIGRGGGSIEDLWAFNDEALARMVAVSKIPVISAVGHETDFTICDFVADLRAPTPSAAAELALPDTEELKQKITNIITREKRLLLGKLDGNRKELERYGRSAALTHPMNFVEDKRMLLGLFIERLSRSETYNITTARHSLAAAAGKLGALNPLSVISRGYSAVYGGDGKLVKSITDVKAGDKVRFRTSDGEVGATVDETTPFETK